MVDNDLSKLRIDKKKFQVHRRKRKSFFFLIAMLVVFTSGGILYVTGILGPAIQTDVVNVSTIYPSQTFTLLNASGYVVAQRKSAVASKITSWLVSLSVEEGSRVKEGEIIARLENKDAIAALDKAKADVEVSRFDLNQAEAELTETTHAYNRTRKLVRQEIATESEFDIAEARYKGALAAVASAKATLQSNKAALKEAEVNLDYTLIRAPFDAVVLTKNADIGDIVTPVGAAANARASVVTIADMNSLQVEADVSESNLGQVKVGQPCEILLDALPDKRFRGEVHMIVPTADRSKASVLVKVSFLNKDTRILPEMSAKVAFLKRRVATSESKFVKAVPVSAVVRQEGRTAIYTVVDNIAVEKKIQVGRQFDNMIEILTGVEVGDKIISEPKGRIEDGTRIKIPED